MKMQGLTPFEREQFIASKAGLARDLDAGGRVVPEMQLLKNLTELKASYLQAEKNVRASAVKTYTKTPGLDEKSAQHVCTANVDLLTELPLRCLARGGAINTGRRITMRVLENPCYSSSIQALVRDVEGAVIKLALYNFLHATARCLDAERVIPPGCTIVIKEPYVKCQLDGSIGIRVDNPCNVVITRLAPPSEGADAPAVRKYGNTLFQLCEFERAADAYGVALNLKPATDIAVACLSNRAAALLRLNRFSEALTDCVAVRTLQPEHGKAIFRSGQALFQLRRYDEACAAYELALKSGPNSAIASELQRAYNAVRGVTGHFDKASLRDGVDFYGPIEIRATGNKGRGLFVTSNVKAGDLMFVERALGHCTPCAKETTFAANYTTMKTSNATQHALVTSLVLAASAHPSINSRLSYLAEDVSATTANTLGIPPMAAIRADTLPQSPPVSAATVYGIVNTNCFGDGCPTDAAMVGESSKFSALWFVLSFMNHEFAATNTTELSILSDRAVVFANQDLEAGAELTTSYSEDPTRLSGWGIK